MKSGQLFLLASIVLLFFCSARAKSEYCSDYYRQQNVGAFKVDAFHAFDKNNLVIVCGSGLSGKSLPPQILTSVNGGKSWQTRWRAEHTFFNKIVFPTRKIGFAVGTQYPDKKDHALILKTTNGGITWRKVAVEISESIEDIQFVNNLTGFALTDKGSVLATTDGGQSWNLVSRNAFNLDDASPVRINFSNNNSGWAITSARVIENGEENKVRNGEIYQTLDGGKTWISRKENFVSLLRPRKPTDVTFEDVKFFDSKTGYVTAHFRQIGEKQANGTRYLNFEGVAVFSTQNGGLSWETTTTEDFGVAFADFSANRQLWIIPTRGWQSESVFSTADFGKTWKRHSTKFTDGGNPKHIYFTDDKTGFLIADLGYEYDDIYRTLDGGKTWKLR
jgi:photosystem II stability/assembly factor-like uncharacterized protein